MYSVTITTMGTQGCKTGEWVRHFSKEENADKCVISNTYSNFGGSCIAIKKRIVFEDEF